MTIHRPMPSSGIARGTFTFTPGSCCRLEADSLGFHRTLGLNFCSKESVTEVEKLRNAVTVILEAGKVAREQPSVVEQCPLGPSGCCSVEIRVAASTCPHPRA